MGIFKKLLEKRNLPEDGPAFRRNKAAALNGRRLRYVSERVPNPDTGAVEDVVIGKDGAIYVKNDELSVICGIKTLFRAYVPELTASDLMSLDGAVLTGLDLESGVERTVVAFYVYYRK